VQVVVGFLEKGFTNVTVETRSGSTLLTGQLLTKAEAIEQAHGLWATKFFEASPGCELTATPRAPGPLILRMISSSPLRFKEVGQAEENAVARRALVSAPGQGVGGGVG
jgi:hypothetical protein